MVDDRTVQEVDYDNAMAERGSAGREAQGALIDRLGFTAAMALSMGGTHREPIDIAAGKRAAVCEKCCGCGRVYGRNGLLPACPLCGQAPWE